MTELSISRAWSETTEFLQREFALLFLIAFLLISLPGVALQYLLPQREPESLTSGEELLQMAQGALIFFPVVLILGTIGTIAITYLAIRPGASVGEALAVGARRFIMLLLAGLFIGFVAMIAFVPMVLLVMPGDASGSLGPMFLLLFVSLVLFLFFWVKLVLVTAIAAAEGGGPFALMARSWALTHGHFRRLLGFMLLFWIAAAVCVLVASVLVGLVVALFLGMPLPGTGAAFALNLVSAAIQAVVSIAFTVAVGRIYAQLVGEIEREIFA